MLQRNYAHEITVFI